MVQFQNLVVSSSCWSLKADNFFWIMSSQLSKHLVITDRESPLIVYSYYYCQHRHPVNV